MKKHFISTHDNKVETITCNICSKTFKIQRSLTNHITMVHRSRKDYKCGSCNKSFSLAGILKKHIYAVHEGHKDYKCQSCSKSFSYAWYLNKHIKTHFVRFGKLVYFTKLVNR